MHNRPHARGAALPQDYQRAFYDNPAPLLICDRDSFRYLAANRAATLLYGYTEDQLLDLTPYDIRPAAERTEFRAWFREFAENAEARRCSLHQRRDGSLVYVTTISRPTEWQGRHAHIVAVVDAAETMDDVAVSLVRRRNYIEADLQRAIEREELRLAFQPIVCARTRAMVGVETLVRWQHPEIGLIHPVDFIDVAEASGQIVDLGAWVLRQACHQGRAWHAINPELRIAVNISAKQVANDAIVHQLAAALDESSLDPALLSLEITESSALTGLQTACNTLRAVRERGVRVALDDFGTGYSALGYLKHLSADDLKIDRLFVKEIADTISDQIIAEAVIDVAHKLNMRVTAEGIESAEQADLLRDLGADYLQGFYFGRPMQANEIEKRLTAA